MTDYVSIWAEAVQAYESLANVVKTADEAIRQSLDLAARVEKLEAENRELKDRLAIALLGSSLFPVEYPEVTPVGPSRVQVLIDGIYEDGFWYVRYGLASVVGANRVRLDSRIVRGWKPDMEASHD